MGNKQTKFIVGILLFTAILTGVLLKGYGFGTQDVFPRAGEPKTTPISDIDEKYLFTKTCTAKPLATIRKF
jgi:hypothetical protein